MIQKKKKHKKKFLINGFSLIELMISIAIIGLVIGASLIAFQTMQKNTATTSIYTKVGQEADFVLRKMERELKQAGYYYPSNDLEPILVQSDLISIDPTAPQLGADPSTNTLTVEDARYFPEDNGRLVIIDTGVLDSEQELVDYEIRNGNIFTGLVVLNPHPIGSNVYEFNSLEDFVSITPEFPLEEEPIITITVCFDEAQNERVLISYQYNREEETLRRLRQTNALNEHLPVEERGDCQLVDPEHEPILDNITDFIIDNSRIYGGRIGVEIELRASEGDLQRFHTAISLPTS